MTSEKISVGIQGFLPEEQTSLIERLDATQLTSLSICMDRYCELEDDYATQEILGARPEIMLVDMRDQRAAIRSLYVLHSVMPSAWLFACSDTDDPKLIIETMQVGAREYLSKPVSANTLQLALGRYIEAKGRLKKESRKRGKIFIVTSAKGGAGATSVAVNLAATLAGSKAARVALLDMNSPVGDIASYVGVQSRYSFSDVLEAAPRLDPVLLETHMTANHGIWILPGPQQLRADEAVTQAGVSKVLHVASQTFTHTFIDIPSSLDPELLRVAVDLSEAILLVFTPELPSLWRTYHLIAHLNSAGFGSRVRLLLNRATSRSDIDNREIQRSLGQPIHYQLPNDYKNSIRAVNRGEPVVLANHSRLASVYHQLVQDLAGIEAAKPRWRFPGLNS